MKVGQMVFSKAGRDCGRPFLVLKVDQEGFAYIADGEWRRVAKPKRKNIKHLQPTTQYAAEIQAKLEAGKMPSDAEVRKALASLYNPPGGEEEGDGQEGRG